MCDVTSDHQPIPCTEMSVKRWKNWLYRFSNHSTGRIQVYKFCCRTKLTCSLCKQARWCDCQQEGCRNLNVPGHMRQESRQSQDWRADGVTYACFLCCTELCSMHGAAYSCHHRWCRLGTWSCNNAGCSELRIIVAVTSRDPGKRLAFLLWAGDNATLYVGSSRFSCPTATVMASA